MKIRLHTAWQVWLLALATLTGMVKPAHAQTDYFNLDVGRPIRIEDAAAKERYAFELTLASLKLERSGAGAYQWSAEPEVAYGVLPRTHIKLGVPVVALDDEAGTQLGVAGVDLAIFHNVNAETSLPAIALSASVLVPAGSFGPDKLHPSLTLIGTRSFRAARVHANVQYTFGSADQDAAADVGARAGAHQTTRWLAGLAVDKALPLHSLLLVADVYAAQSIDADDALSWNAEAGLRYQLNPGLALDAGIGKALRGGGDGWFVTFGTAYAFGLRSLIPVRR